MTFNRVLRRFRDDLSRPEYRAQLDALDATVARLRARGIAVRLDAGREWENAHVLLELERLRAERPVRSVLDFGGGGSPMAHRLAELGLEVIVLDIDAGVVAQVDRAARVLAEPRLGARLYDGTAWPFEPATFDAVISISVFEGILRKRRPQYFSEARRVLRAGGSLLMTFDYGEGARFVGDPPTSTREVRQQIVEASGMELVGEPFRDAEHDAEIGPPVKAIVRTPDGFDAQVAAYSFAAVHLRRSRAE